MNETALELYDYQLPQSSIAQQPLPQRDQARLLVDMGAQNPPQHLKIADLPDLLNPGDVVVANDARVLKARLKLNKATGGRVEVLALQPSAASGGVWEASTTDRNVWEANTADRNVWEALVRPSRRVPPGTELLSADGQAVLVVGEDLGEGKRLVRPAGQLAISDLLEKMGEVPLPPYITASLPDSERYQTVLADRPTAVAAPTAGLHLTSAVLTKLETRGIAVHSLNLAVGLGTFRPITTANIADHLIHEESYQIPQGTWDACLRARAAGNKVVAIGTTVVRSLEAASLRFKPHGRSGETQSAALNSTPDSDQNTALNSDPENNPETANPENNPRIALNSDPENNPKTTDPLCGNTDLYIFPGFRFQMVDALLTNFHLPRSTLLVLLAAFMGHRWRQLYETAQSEDYRFLSFGDAMFCHRQA